MIKPGMRRWMLVALPALIVACSLDARQELPSATLVLTNGIVIDGTGADPIVDGLVAMDGNRIVAVGPSVDFKIPKDVTVIDAGGGTILPGVINAHTHGVARVATRRHVFLLDGVTSVCDLGNLLILMPEFEQEDTQFGPAARGFKAGPFLTVPGGSPSHSHGPISYEIQGEREAELAVRDLRGRGADFIMVYLEPGPYFHEFLPVLDPKNSTQL